MPVIEWPPAKGGLCSGSRPEAGSSTCQSGSQHPCAFWRYVEQKNLCAAASAVFSGVPVIVE
jgi:hypothetical protein